jgi:Transcription factor WhiB
MVAVQVEHGPGYDAESLAYAVGVLISSLDRDHPWRKDALCREHPEVNFFTGRGESTAPAVRVCSHCAVRAECRQFATTAISARAEGVWAGESAKQRRRARYPVREKSARSPETQGNDEN